MKSQEQTRFIILGTQRSGTTLIASTLRAYPDITQVGEVFVWHREAPVTYRAFVEQSAGRRLLHHLWRRATVRAYLDQFFAEHQTRAVGFKLMYSQTSWLPHRYPYIVPYLEQGDFRVIHVYRENLLRTRLSAAAARVGGTYHAPSSAAPTRNAPITVDPKQIIKEMRRMERERIAWSRWAAKHNTLEFSYEDFVQNRDQRIQQMVKFLGVNDPEVRYSRLQKVSPKQISGMVENYTELCRAVSDTRYAKYLDD